MFINTTGFYIPSQRISNDYFFEINGLTSDWILQRTGIETRSKVGKDEDSISMGKAAVAKAVERLPYSINDIDLIISSGYTPLDTVGTLAHVIQREYRIENAAAMMVSSACSSFINALEIVEGYFCSGKARKALIICSEQNTYYSRDNDPQSGHLWGDAAVAMFVSKERISKDDPEILTIVTRGLGHIGKGPEGVYLHPKTDGLVMPDGRDVFVNATKYMVDMLKTIVEKNNVTIADLNYIIPHQANMRIVANVLHQLNLPNNKALNNIQKYGNTGSASSILALLENWNIFKKDDLIGITVFGGGYSSGGTLIRF